MAIGPLARLLAQLVVPVVAVLARALPAAYAQALQNARKAGVDHHEAAKSVLRKTISKAEALQVLNLTEEKATAEAIQKVISEKVGSQVSWPMNSGLLVLQPLAILFVFSKTISAFPHPNKQYEKYMAANDVKKGGSFYLQSKIYRAKELLDEFQKEKRMEEKQRQQQSTTASSSSESGSSKRDE